MFHVLVVFNLIPGWTFIMALSEPFGPKDGCRFLHIYMPVLVKLSNELYGTTTLLSAVSGHCSLMYSPPSLGVLLLLDAYVVLSSTTEYAWNCFRNVVDNFVSFKHAEVGHSVPTSWSMDNFSDNNLLHPLPYHALRCSLAHWDLMEAQYI